MKRAAAYSTGAHDGTGEEALLKAYARKQGCTIVEEYQEDPSDPARPQLQRLIAESGEKRIEALVVRSLDHLAHSPGLLVETLGRLGDRGISLLSCAEDLNAAKRTGRAFLAGIKAVTELKLQSAPQPSEPGRKNRPGRHALQFDEEEGVRLRLEADMSYGEIGKVLGVSKTTAYSRIMRALLKRL